MQEVPRRHLSLFPGVRVDQVTNLPWLVTLAHCFEELERAQKTVTRSARKERDGQELLQEYEEDHVAARKSEEELAKCVRDCERTIQDLEDRIARKHQQQDLIRDNKEYKAFSEEIANLQANIDALETEALTALDQHEKEQQKSAALAAELQVKGEEIAERNTTLDRAATAAEEKLAALTEEIATCLSQLEVEIATSVKRMSEHMPLPVVWLDGETCGGCHAQFPTQKAIAIERGRLVERCQTCGRYVIARP